MDPDRRKPPGGLGRLSKNVLADGFDFLRDNPTGLKKQVSAAPPDFDPAAHPIVARHFFGIEPFRQIGDVAAKVIADLKRQRQIEHLHQLGPRAVGELLCEVAEGGDLDHALAAYERLTPALLKAVGGDRFSPLPIHEVKP